LKSITLQAVRLLALLLLGLLPTPLLALDHDNLDPNRPIGMEDAYAIPKGEIELEGGVRFNDRREGSTRVTFQPQIIYGAFDNMQIEIQGDLLPSRTPSSARTSPAICIWACSTTSILRR
jgi:hypothetical protein